MIDRARAQAAGKNVTLEAHVIAGHPVSSIVEFIRQGGYDLLVIGYMGHSALYNRVIGSTTDRLVELAPCTGDGDEVRAAGSPPQDSVPVPGRSGVECPQRGCAMVRLAELSSENPDPRRR